jgi:zinc transporter 2
MSQEIVELKERLVNKQGDETKGDLTPKKERWEIKKDKYTEEAKSAQKKLMVVISITATFMIIEIIGGLMADSIAIISDAAHLGSDVLGFGVTIWALSMSRKQSGGKHTFGYHRAEVLGTIFSIFTIWAMVAYLVNNAIGRFMHPGAHPIEGAYMLIVSCCGLGFNLI